ncbi:hypothetical protein Tco_1159844 [Tanacetum coccineum]
MESSSEGTGTMSGVPDELSGKTKVSNEGAGITPEGSTDDEDPILSEDKENLKEKVEDIPWDSSDNDESSDEEDEVSDDERNESDVKSKESDERKESDDEIKKDEGPEEQKVDKEQQKKEVHDGMKQPMGEQAEVPVFTTQQEKSTMLQLTSSQSISSNFANQFLNSPNASLVGIILKNNEPEIISMMDVHIQQEYLRTSMPEVFRKELQNNIENLKKELSELNYKEIIKELVKAQVAKEVNNILPQLLQKAISDFTTPVIQAAVTATVQSEIKTQLSTILPEVASPMIQDALSKPPVVSTRSSAQLQSSY